MKVNYAVSVKSSRFSCTDGWLIKGYPNFETVQGSQQENGH